MLEVRLILTDEIWVEIAPILSQVKHPAGCPPQQSDRMFIEAVLYLARTGIPWRDLPPCLGNWSAVYHRFRRWEKSGIWQHLWEHLQADEFSGAKQVFIDSTTVRAHQHAAGALKKKGGQQAQALGRSCGGFTSKIHIGCIDENTPVSIVISAGQRHDTSVFELVFEGIPQPHSLSDAIMDRGYDSDQIRQRLADENINAVIPPKKNRTQVIPYDKYLYSLREKVERFFNKIKQFRRIATRYEKLAETFLAFIHITASFLIVK